MNIEKARSMVGKLVMSRDAGFKMIKCTPELHGPYTLLAVTKEGYAILSNSPSHLRVSVSLLEELRPNLLEFTAQFRLGTMPDEIKDACFSGKAITLPEFCGLLGEYYIVDMTVDFVSDFNSPTFLVSVVKKLGD